MRIEPLRNADGTFQLIIKQESADDEKFMTDFIDDKNATRIQFTKDASGKVQTIEIYTKKPDHDPKKAIHMPNLSHLGGARKAKT